MEPEVWFRYEDFRVSNGVDEWENSLGSHTAIRLVKLRVVKHTPKGVRLEDGKVVIKDHHKKYALPTKELALESFLARKNREIEIYTCRIQHAKEAIELAKANKRSRYGADLS